MLTLRRSRKKSIRIITERSFWKSEKERFLKERRWILKFYN